MTMLPMSSALSDSATNTFSARGPSRFTPMHTTSITAASSRSVPLPGSSMPSRPVTNGAAA